MANGRKNILPSFNSIVNASMASNITSPVTEIRYLDDIGVQFNFSGAPVGTFSVQVSADYAVDPFGHTVLNPGNWISITLTYWNGTAFVSGTSIPTSVGSPIYIDLQQLSAPYIRLIYTAASGSGTLNAYITAKEV